MTSTRTRAATLATLLAFASGCACDTVPSNALESCSAAEVIPGSVKTDILFVIDDSGSMQAEQAALQAALSMFVTALSNSPVKDDFQIGVTTTTVACDPTASCTAPITAGSLIGTPAILHGSSPNLVQDFNATIGTIGLAGNWEQPLEAMKLAIGKSAVASEPNYGFIRPGARLAVFLMSDEDDCSTSDPTNTTPYCAARKAAGTLNPVSDYVSFLRSPIGGEVKDVVVYGVAGFSPDDRLVLSCSSPTLCSDTTCSTAADKGDRFLALTQAFGTSGRIGSICSPDLSPMLLEFAGVIMSQTMPLEGAPADPRLLVATVTKATGQVVSCGTAALAGTPEAATANAIYTPPREGRPASLTFQFDCALGHGDRVDLKVICAG